MVGGAHSIVVLSPKSPIQNPKSTSPGGVGLVIIIWVNGLAAAVFVDAAGLVNIATDSGVEPGAIARWASGEEYAIAPHKTHQNFDAAHGAGLGSSHRH